MPAARTQPNSLAIVSSRLCFPLNHPPGKSLSVSGLGACDRLGRGGRMAPSPGNRFRVDSASEPSGRTWSQRLRPGQAGGVRSLPGALPSEASRSARCLPRAPVRQPLQSHRRLPNRGLVWKALLNSEPHGPHTGVGSGSAPRRVQSAHHSRRDTNWLLSCSEGFFTAPGLADKPGYSPRPSLPSATNCLCVPRHRSRPNRSIPCSVPAIRPWPRGSRDLRRGGFGTSGIGKLHASASFWRSPGNSDVRPYGLLERGRN